jgi:hypothetical protein
MQTAMQDAASQHAHWTIAVAAVAAGLLLPHLEVAPGLIPFALALLAGIAKSGTA